MQGLAKPSSSLNKKRIDGRRGISFACCHSHLCCTSYVFLQGQTRDKLNKNFFPCWCATGSSFSAGVQNSLLSFSDTKMVFFPCWCYKKFLTIFFHGNQTKWPLVINHINWVDDHQTVITAKYGTIPSLVIEKKHFIHFPIISLWDLSIVIATKQKGRST